MANVKIIDAAAWAALPEISLSEGEDLATKGIASDTYRCIRSDVASAVVTQWTGLGVEWANEVGAPSVYTVDLTANGVEWATEVGSPVVSLADLIATGVEWANEVGAPTVTEAGGGLTVVAVSGGHEVTAGAGTENVTIPGTPATGDRVVVIRVSDSGLSSSQSTGYTDVIDDGGSSTPGYCIEVKTMGGTPDSVVEVPQTGARQAVIVALLRGVNATFLDQTIPTPWTGNSSNSFPPAVTTQTNGALVMCVAGLDDDDTDASTFPSGYTDTAMSKTSAGDSSNGASAAVAFKTVATAGTETPGSFSWGSTDSGVGITIAIKPA